MPRKSATADPVVTISDTPYIPATSDSPVVLDPEVSYVWDQPGAATAGTVPVAQTITLGAHGTEPMASGTPLPDPQVAELRKEVDLLKRQVEVLQSVWNTVKQSASQPAASRSLGDKVPYKCSRCAEITEDDPPAVRAAHGRAPICQHCRVITEMILV